MKLNVFWGDVTDVWAVTISLMQLQSKRWLLHELRALHLVLHGAQSWCRGAVEDYSQSRRQGRDWQVAEQLPVLRGQVQNFVEEHCARERVHPRSALLLFAARPAKGANQNQYQVWLFKPDRSALRKVSGLLDSGLYGAISVDEQGSVAQKPSGL